jgi:hypothetical protein
MIFLTLQHVMPSYLEKKFSLKTNCPKVPNSILAIEVIKVPIIILGR